MWILINITQCVSIGESVVDWLSLQICLSGLGKAPTDAFGEPIRSLTSVLGIVVLANIFGRNAESTA